MDERTRDKLVQVAIKVDKTVDLYFVHARNQSRREDGCQRSPL